MRRKVVELHKSRNGHKKISKQLKIPISTIMDIIKKFKATGDVKNQPGRGCVCTLNPRTVRRMARLAITAGELQRLVESTTKTSKKKQPEGPPRGGMEEGPTRTDTPVTNARTTTNDVRTLRKCGCEIGR